MNWSAHILSSVFNSKTFFLKEEPVKTEVKWCIFSPNTEQCTLVWWGNINFYPLGIHSQSMHYSLTPGTVAMKYVKSYVFVADWRCSQTLKALLVSVLKRRQRNRCQKQSNSSQGRKNKYWRKTVSCQNRWPRN